MCSPSADRRRVRTPSRLHFTLIDLNGERGRVDGSVGLTLDWPTVELDAESAPADAIAADEAVTVEAVQAERLRLRPGPGGPLRITVRSVIPRHVGLGSGTQLRLAVLAASLARKPTIAQLAATGRGGASGLGIHGFVHGGFIVDGGHARGDKAVFAPSRFAQDVPPPPLIARHTFPDRWRVCLYQPITRGGLSGEQERSFMAAMTPLPRREVDEVCHAVLLGLLPAVVSEDLTQLGMALNVLQDVGWKARHWRRPELAPLGPARGAFARAGLLGCGLSSTGPTLFGFFDAASRSGRSVRTELAVRLREADLPPGRIDVTAARNHGAEITTTLEGVSR